MWNKAKCKKKQLQKKGKKEVERIVKKEKQSAYGCAY